MDVAIALDHVSKSFGSHRVVDDLCLTVRQGEIFGFLGPNGAGKTTTINMLLGLLSPDGGRISLLGLDIGQHRLGLRSRIGVMGEQQYLYDDMTAWEYLLFFARLYAVPQPQQRITRLMEMVGLSSFLSVRARDYSHGMKQKLGLVRAMLHQPELLILDEPVSGLDPTGIAQVRAILQGENGRGTTIFLSSHILSEIERMAHRVGIIARGQLVAEDTMDGLRQRLGGNREIVIELANLPSGLLSSLNQLPYVHGVTVQGAVLTLSVAADQDYRSLISQTLAHNGAVILSMNARLVSLEDAFLTLTEQNVGLLTRGEARP